MKKTGYIFLVAIITALTTVFAVRLFDKKAPSVIIKEVNTTQPTKLANYNTAIATTTDFVKAAEITTPTVVHITTSTEVKTVNRGRNPFWDFFGEDFGFPEQQPQVGSGSGVIISNDGYIVTNNHVIEHADKIEVTLNDRQTFEAKLVGTDPSTDIAVVKIERDEHFDFLTFGNSDNVKVGEWVLAVGNPFNLASTVTAGIVSAKGRNINLLREKAGSIAIESFIQTDAAVNPGNSGGALVNAETAELIGINTAIATPTGTYAGYSFAVPSNLVKKVVDDIVDYGVVQRGLLGVMISDLNAELVEELELNNLEGIYVSEVMDGGGAKEAGILAGDVIVSINDTQVKTSPELQELVARHRPGDQIKVKLIRDGSQKSIWVTLKSKNNSTDLLSKSDVEKEADIFAKLGVVLEDISLQEARKYGVRGGIKVKKIKKEGVLAQQTDIKEGFIITRLNNQPIYSVKELKENLERFQGEGVLLEGKYPGVSGTTYYAFGMK